MKRFCLPFLFCCFSAHSQLSLSDEDYQTRFKHFQNYFQQLPLQPDQTFLTFVDDPRPLSRAVREKWLYELGRIKDWHNYKAHYQTSHDPNLQCFALNAEYFAGNQTAALTRALMMWLSPYTLPKACDMIFDVLKKTPLFNNELITARLSLALSNKNLHLASYLVKQLKPSSPEEERLLLKIHQNPQSITNLTVTPLHGLYYLYGLKRLLTVNLNKAISTWKLDKTKQILSIPQQQDFLNQLAITKAIRHDKDTKHWFSQIKPTYYQEHLLEWQIRHALTQNNYQDVLRFILLTENPNTPDWQYWRARALEATGQQTQAQTIYRALAQKRHYYGFLASYRLKQQPHFEHESNQTNAALLKPYHDILNTIQTLYTSGHKQDASRIIYHFSSELPKAQISALAWWLQTQLHWHAKSVQISNDDRLQNQLALRFPLIYKKTVLTQAKTRALSPELIYAIIRQESIYRTDTVSGAGALGLMQLMPSTARLMSRTFKIGLKNNKALFEEGTNIRLGSAYLADLAKRFKQHPVLMAGAYNAGPRQIKRWMNSFNGDDVDRFIETIPWQETRNYLKNVLAYYVVYQYMLQKKPDLTAVVATIPS